MYRLHKTELNSISEKEERYKRLVEINVQEQCINVIKTADVQKAIKERNLRIHGWVFDIGTGKLINLQIETDKIMNEITEIYRII